MTYLAPTDLTAVLSWRYATKKFDPTRTIPADLWAKVEETLVLTPSSFGLQPWRFLIITDRALRESIVPAAWGQRQVADSSHLIAFAAAENQTAADIDAFIAHTAKVRGQPVEALQGYRNVMVGWAASKSPAELHAWAVRQAYLAFGQVMLTAALLGLDACPMEGFEPEKVNTILGLDGSGFRVAALCPVGYRAADDKYATAPKVRFPAEQVIVRR